MKNKVKVPTTPNLIICNGVALPLNDYDYDDDALETIGKYWVANLIRKKKRLAQDKEITL